MHQKVRKGEELKIEPLLNFLKSENLIDSSMQDMEIRQFSNGFSNLTYLLKIGQNEWVLRRPPFGAVKRGHDMGREYKILSRLYKSFPKAPKALAYTENKDILGAPFYIMEKKNGIILTYGECIKRNVSPDDFQKISNRWLDTFIELHQVDFEAVGLGDLGKPNGYVERQVTNWGKQYLKAATMEVPEALKIMKWMEDNQPRSYDASLIHNDYKYDNIVFKDENWEEVNAVLDWEMCTLGDPLMDLGTSIAYWSVSTDSDFILKGWPSPTALEGNPKRTELVEMYARKSGRSINNLVFYYVYGLFKIAVICQQIYYRYNKGLTTDKRFAHLDKAAQMFCIMGWQSIQKNKIEDLF